MSLVTNWPLWHPLLSLQQISAPWSVLPEAGKLPPDSPSQSSCDHPPGRDSSSQPKTPRPEDVHQTLLSRCQEAARGIKHDVMGRQLPSCLLSAPCPCMRDVIAGAYTSTALFQLLETYCTLQETHYSKTIPCQFSLRPAGSCGEETTHHATLQSLSFATVNPGRRRPAVTMYHSSLNQNFLGHLQGQLEKYPHRSLNETRKLKFHEILAWKRFTENQSSLAAGSRTNQ